MVDQEVMYYDLPEDTIEECLIKVIECDEAGDFEVAHKCEEKALVLFTKYVHENPNGKNVSYFAGLITSHLKIPRGSRWYA